MVTAKITCQSKTESGEGNDRQVQVAFIPDYADGRNKEWSRWTPSLSLSMTLKGAVADRFEQGKAYTLTFEPAARESGYIVNTPFSIMAGDAATDGMTLLSARQEEPMQKPTLGRIVHYRGKQGLLAYRAAIVTATVASLDPRGVASGEVPALNSDEHVHLWVFTPGEKGGFAEFNVPRGEVDSASPGSEDIEPGTWAWPPRV